MDEVIIRLVTTELTLFFICFPSWSELVCDSASCWSASEKQLFSDTVATEKFPHFCLHSVIHFTFFLAL